MNGKVYLIGAGPGDPGLLTLRGAELLRRASVVLYDGLSNSEILAHAPTAEQICVGKHGQSRIWRQDEIIDEMLRHARGGACVVRLKGGDPAVFARTAEEAEALRDAGIEFEIVPGITAALAAGSYAGIPITHRRFASAVALVTGHEEPGKSQSSLDWDALARFPGTLVIYMGVTTVAAWTAALIGGGKSPATPAAILRRCSLPDQQIIHCRLDEVAEHLTPATKLRPPVIVIVGEVTGLAQTMSWFETRPLFAKRVLVTRSEQQAGELATPLRELGAEVIEQPLIEIGPPENWSDIDAVIADLLGIDTLIFTSQNGVCSFLDRLMASGKDARSLASTKLAVVGAKTAHALAQYHLRADVVPADFSAESLAEQLRDQAPGQRFVWLRASRGPDLLAERLREFGGNVSEVIAYTHRDLETVDPQTLARLERNEIHWVPVTSGAIATALIRLCGQSLHRTKLATLAPAISQTFTDAGFTVAAEAKTATIQSLVHAIQTAEAT